MSVLKGFKTVGVNFLVALIGLVVALSGEEPPIMSPEQISQTANEIYGGIIAAIGVVNMYLRWITTTEIFRRD